MRKVLVVEGLSWLTCLFNSAWKTVPKEWQTRYCVLTTGALIYSAFMEKDTLRW